MTTRRITPAQITRIELDAARAGFDNPQDAVDLVPGVSSRNWRYDLNTIQASAVIKALDDGLVPPAPEVVDPASIIAAPEGGVPAADALGLIGKRVRMTSAVNPDVEWVGRVVSISASSKDGTPAFDLILDNGRTQRSRLSVVATWAVL